VIGAGAKQSVARASRPRTTPDTRHPTLKPISASCTDQFTTWFYTFFLIFAQLPLPGNTTLLAIQETGTYRVAAKKETPQGTGLNGAKLRGYGHLNRNLNPNLDLNLLVENGLRLRL
jgi:hypothetical protein